MGELFSQDEIDKAIDDIKPYWRDDMSPHIEPDNCGNYVVMQPTSESKEQGMIDIKQYLEETNTVLLTKETFEHLKKRACVLDKIRAEIEHLTITEGGEDYTRKMAELYSLKIKVLQIIDKYKAESEESDADSD